MNFLFRSHQFRLKLANCSCRSSSHQVVTTGFQTHVNMKRINAKNVEKVKKRVSTKKVKTVTIKKRINTKVKKVTTPVNKGSASPLNARELLIMLKRRPEIVAMGKAHNVMSTDFLQGQFADYLKFLVVKGIEKDFNTMKISPPCTMVDSFWHSHILDTAAYHSTCVHLFGQYVHHKSLSSLFTMVKMKAYWDAHHKHFPGDEGDGDEDDGDDSDSTEGDEDAEDSESIQCG